MIRRTGLPVMILAAAAGLGATLAMTSAARTGEAQPAAAAVMPENAALQYWRSWHLQEKSLHTLVGERFRGADFEWRPDAELADALVHSQASVRGVLKAAYMRDCDWGVQRDEGMLALLPHLGLLRQSARLLGADARRCFAAGDTAGAATRVEAIVRLSRHSGVDGCLISSLVQVAILDLGTTQVQFLIQNGAMTPEQRASLAEWLRTSLPAHDPFGMRAALQGESSMIIQSCLKYTGPDAGKRMQDELGGLVNGGEQRSIAIDALDGPFLAQSAQQLDGYYTQCLAAWDAPDSVEQLQTLSKAAADGAFGPVATILAPALGNARKSDLKAQARLQSLIEMLETGDTQPLAK